MWHSVLKTWASRTPGASSARRGIVGKVGLADSGKRETAALSGGQKQRVAIAGVLAMHPSILIFDEASAMLDPRGRRGLMRVCKEFHEQGMTVIMITHFMEEAAEADRVIVLNDGRCVLDGAPTKYLHRTTFFVILILMYPSPPTCRAFCKIAASMLAPTSKPQR